MKVTFLSIAETEFVEAIKYYNKRSQGLGYEFAAEVKATIHRIIQYPEAWSIVTKETRKIATDISTRHSAAAHGRG